MLCLSGLLLAIIVEVKSVCDLVSTGLGVVVELDVLEFLGLLQVVVDLVVVFQVVLGFVSPVETLVLGAGVPPFLNSPHC